MHNATQIEQEIQKSNRVTRFGEKLELRYQNDIHQTRQHHLTLCLIIGCITFSSFVLWKVFINPEDLFRTILKMLGTSLISTTLGVILVRMLSTRWRESVALIPSYTGFLTSYDVVVNGAQPIISDQPLFIFCWPLMLIYVNTCMKSPFKTALRYNIFCIVITSWAVHQAPISASAGGLMMTAIGSSAFFSLLGNYWSNSEVRRSYLYWLREETRASSLSDANNDLQRLSETDTLTGLANRRQVQPQLDLLTDDHINSKSDGAVLLIDIDHFKKYNDYYGHILGDECLRIVANTLSSCINNKHAIARFGGEEFIAILPNVEPEEARNIANLLLHSIDALNIPHLGRADGVSNITVSIGMAHSASVEITDNAPLLDQADRALYRAKRSGRNRIEDAGSISPLGDESLLTPEDIRIALSERQFELHFQPIYQLEPYKLIGYESLIRWQHPKLGMVPPDLFIGMAERSGLIETVGEWVLKTACTQASQWPNSLTLSVNLSPLQLVNPDLPAKVAALLESTGLPGNRLLLELTEGAPLRIDEHVLNSIEQIKSFGVRFALDDFGQGHANLAYLLQLSFDVLKIDRQALQIADPAKRFQVLQALLMLGQTFEVKVIAEGVESADDLSLLRKLGFDHAQGYFLGRPQPILVSDNKLLTG